MGQLLRAAARVFARPCHVFTDLGTESTGKAFTRTVKRLGASHRFAAKDSVKATARLEGLEDDQGDAASAAEATAARE
jgi:hypothetical protein